MGVPAFFRWLTLRYPKCVVDSHASNLQHDLPSFDNLYLDMNGIIHPCCRPDSGLKLTEADMFAAICKYVDSLCAIVRPRKLIYLAIDGVAPRAKMNQQRARRYRKIQEEQEKSKNQGAKPTPSFDSNVITPGTEFMHRLADALNDYIQQKLRAEWSDLTVIFSVRLT